MSYSYNARNMNTNYCWHRLPCGICELTNKICPKHSSTTYLNYPIYNTNTSQTAVGKPDEDFNIKVTGEKNESNINS